MSTPKWEAGHLYLKGDLVQPVQAVGGVSVTITNAGFESGDTAWTKGAGWVVTNAVSAYAGSYTGEFQGAFAGPSVISMATAAACSPGQSITAKVKVNTGGNSVNDAGAAIRLTWLTAADAVIRVDEGNICRGGGNAWFESGVTATAPANAEKVAVGCNAYRNDGTDALWIDNFTWNHVTPTAQEGLIYKAVQDDPGFSDSVEPAWPTTLGVQVVDNEVIWEAVLASRVTYEARPILKSGATEPTWPTTPGAFVVDGTISWECVSRRIEDENCPNTKVVHILAGKVFAADDDIIRFCATANPLDWTAPEDAGYLPSGLQSANGNGMSVLHQYRGNLGAFNANCFQNWQADPNPAAMAILDQIDGIGSTWPKAAQAVANDLLFLSQRGVRSVGIAAGAENLSAGDVGIPVDVLVQESLRVATANGSKVLSTHYPGAGQYWLAFADYPPPALSISGDLGDGYQDDVETGSYSSAGGVLPHTFAVTAGTFPAGLTLASDGSWSGTRTTTGTYNWTVTVTDSDGNTATLDDTSTTYVAVSLISAQYRYKGQPDALTALTNGPTFDVQLFAARDGSAIAGKLSGSAALVIYRWTAATSTYDAQVITGATPVHDASEQWCAVSPDGSWVLALARVAGTVYVYEYDGAGYTLRNTFASGIANARGVCFNDDGDQFAVCFESTVTRTYSLAANGDIALLATSSGGSGSHRYLHWNGDYIVGSEPNSGAAVRVWTASTMVRAAEADNLTFGGVGSRAFINGMTVYAVGNDGGTNKAITFTLDAGAGTLTTVNTYALAATPANAAFHPDGTFLFVGFGTGNDIYSIAGTVLTAETDAPNSGNISAFTGLI